MQFANIEVQSVKQLYMTGKFNPNIYNMNSERTVIIIHQTTVSYEQYEKKFKASIIC